MKNLIYSDYTFGSRGVVITRATLVKISAAKSTVMNRNVSRPVATDIATATVGCRYIYVLETVGVTRFSAFVSSRFGIYVGITTRYATASHTLGVNLAISTV